MRLSRKSRCAARQWSAACLSPPPSPPSPPPSKASWTSTTTVDLRFAACRSTIVTLSNKANRGTPVNAAETARPLRVILSEAKDLAAHPVCHPRESGDPALQKDLCFSQVLFLLWALPCRAGPLALYKNASVMANM